MKMGIGSERTRSMQRLNVWVKQVFKVFSKGNLTLEDGHEEGFS